MMLSITLEYIRVKEEVRTDAITVMTIIDLEIGHLVGTEIHLIEVEEVLAEIIDHITEVDHMTILEMTTDRTITEMIIDKTIIEETIDKIIIENKGIEIGVEVKEGIVTVVTTEVVQERTLNEVGILVETEVRKNN